MRSPGTAVLSFFIRTVGRLSTGIDMSFRYGFISGKMLDYVYKNKAHGRFFIGRVLDRIYLDNPGWKAIRMRKEFLKGFIREAVEKDRRRGIRPVILDVASGPGSYLLEILAEDKQGDIIVICQDIDGRWLEFGRQQAAAMGIAGIRYEKGDALDLELLKKVSPAPTIVVASGFYDWITDDGLVKRSLGNCARILAPGGQIVFTNQAGHLQMELVSSAFVDLNGQPLRMKTRPPEQVNGWARDAGFRMDATKADGWGLYSTSWGEKT